MFYSQKIYMLLHYDKIQNCGVWNFIDSRAETTHVCIFDIDFFINNFDIEILLF